MIFSLSTDTKENLWTKTANMTEKVSLHDPPPPRVADSSRCSFFPHSGHCPCSISCALNFEIFSKIKFTTANMEPQRQKGEVPTRVLAMVLAAGCATKQMRHRHVDEYWTRPHLLILSASLISTRTEACCPTQAVLQCLAGAVGEGSLLLLRGMDGNYT